jgi:hypothetical protein
MAGRRGEEVRPLRRRLAVRTAAVLRWLPDSSAIGLTVISLTGLALLFYLKLKRFPGPLVAMGGAAALVAVIMFLAP